MKEYDDQEIPDQSDVSASASDDLEGNNKEETEKVITEDADENPNDNSNLQENEDEQFLPGIEENENTENLENTEGDSLNNSNQELAPYIADQNDNRKMTKSFKATLLFICIFVFYAITLQFGSYRQIKHKLLLFLNQNTGGALSRSLNANRTPLNANPMGQNIGLITQNPSVSPVYNDEKESVYRL